MSNRGSVREIEYPEQYAGEEAIQVAATQIDSLSDRAKSKLVEAWMEFFSAGSTPIKSLHFTTRTPRRLFDTLSAQTQLESLRVKWGDYADLEPIRVMHNLRSLHIQSLPSVKTLEPLTAHPAITSLVLEGLRDAHDMSPIGTMPRLRNLNLGGDSNSLRIAHIDSLEFVKGLPDLEELLLQCLTVDSLDYAPLLSLKKLKMSWVKKSRGMMPTYEDLAEALPGWDG